MVRGTLEVLLVSAKGLEDGDIFDKMDPYVILTCRSQEQKSSTKKGAGSNPEWNERFVFTVSDDVSELHLKIMDHDFLTQDDIVGEAKIHLEPVFMEGNLPPTIYNVVKDEVYHGQIKVALTFTPSTPHHGSPHKESYGGWNESARDF